MSTDLPLGLGEVLLNLNADRIVDVLAPGRLSDNPGKQMKEQNAYIYFVVEVNPEPICVDILLSHVRHTYFFLEWEFVESLKCYKSKDYNTFCFLCSRRATTAIWGASCPVNNS